MTQRFRIDTENVLSKEVDGELVLLDVKSQLYIGGNRSTAVLWPLLEKGATTEELAGALVSSFGIDEHRADADVGSLIGQLRERELLAEDPQQG
jgi:hypothetical protein